MTATITAARSFLFVPGSRPERFLKALETPAGCVILDLEDAVPAELKSAARGYIADSLSGFSQAQLGRTMVRINAADTQWQVDDLHLLARWIPKGLAGVMMPKSENESVLQAAAAALGETARLVPLIESLAGLDVIDRLAHVPQVTRLAFGHLDFQLDLGMLCSVEEAELTPVRLALVAASRRAKLAAPVDGVTTATDDMKRLRVDAQRSRAFGFGAKLCIHPAQVSLCNVTFGPSEFELAWAERVVAAAKDHEGQAFRLEGRMVDLPVIQQALRTLRQV